MTGLIKNIIIILGLVALAAIGYYLFVADRSANLSSSGAVGVSSAEVETRAFLGRLGELENIQLSGDIFNDKRFRSLQDFGQAVAPTAVGRVNPFEAPAGIITGGSSN